MKICFPHFPFLFLPFSFFSHLILLQYILYLYISVLFTSFIFWKATNLNSLDTSRIVQILTLSLRIKIAFKWWMFVKRNSLVLYSNNLYLAVSVLFSDPLGDSLRPSERKKNATFLYNRLQVVLERVDEVLRVLLAADKLGLLIDR